MLINISIILLGVVGASYLFLAILFFWGTFRSGKQSGKQENPQKRIPFVSVIVAARDEENTIGQCLGSLLRQDYPKDRFEILVVDDRSSDRTADIAKELASPSASLAESCGVEEFSSDRFPNLHLVRVEEEPPGLSGKQNALAIGIERSRGEIVLMTDADCTVPVGWISGMVGNFRPDFSRDPAKRGQEVGLVGGVILLRGANLFAKLQCLDLLYLLTIAWGAIGIGKPTSLIGNNLGFRRKAYMEVGGYEAIGFTVTEDLALLEAIRDTSDWKIRFTADPSQTVTAFPTNTFRQFLQQRKRWAIGGLKIPAFGLFVLITAFSLRALVIAFLLLSPFTVTYFLLAGIAFLAMISSDFLIASRGLFSLGRKDLLRYLPVLIPFQLFYQLIVGTWIIVGGRGIYWKGREYGADSV